MADLSVTGEVVVTSEKAEAAFDRVGDKATQMATEVAGAAGKAGQAVDGIGAGAEKSADKFTRAESRMRDAIKRSTQELQLLGKTASEKLEFNIQAKGLDASKFAPYIEELKKAEAAQKIATSGLDNMGMSAKATAAAMRNVPAQFQDIIVSLQGGQAPMTVFLQQGSQLSSMFGGAGNAAKALGGYVLGLVNPFTVAAAAGVALAVAYNQGSKEADAYRLAIVSTGNAAGTTGAQLKGYAQEISGVIGTQGKAAESLAAFVSTGRVSRDVLKEAAQAAVAWERATGQAVGTTAKQFADLAKDPLDAVLKLNEGTNFLTVSIYKQIKGLEEQGRTAEAAAVAQRAWAGALTGRSAEITQNLGYIEAAWKGVTDAAKKSWDAMLNVGRASTPADAMAELRTRLARQQEELAAKKAINPYADTSGMEKGIEILKQRLGLLESDERQQRRLAEAEAQRGAQTRAFVQWEKEGDQFKQKAAKRDEEINKAEVEGRALIAAGLIKEADLRERIAGIREKYKETGAAGTGENEVATILARNAQAVKYLERLRAQIAGQGALTDVVKPTQNEELAAKLQKELETSIKGVARAQKEKALAAAEAGIQTDKDIAAAEKQKKALIDLQNIMDKQVDAAQKQADAIRDQAVGQEAVNANFGKSKTAIEQATLAQLKLQLAEADSSDRFAPAYIAALDAKTKAQGRYVEALQKAEYLQANQKLDEAARSAQEETVSLQLQMSLLGMSQVEREKIIAQRQVEVKLAKELADIEKLNLGEGPEAAAKREELRAKARANAVIEGNNAAAKVVLAEWDRTADQINQSLTDALLRGFESGKGFAENLRSTLKNMFSTLVLRPIISAVMSPVSTAITGVMNSMGMGAASSMGTSLLGNIGSSALISGLGSSIAGAVGSSLGAIFGTGVGNVALGTTLGLGASSSTAAALAAAQAGGAATGGIASAGSLFSGIGAAMPWIAGAAAIYSIAKSFDNSGTPHMGAGAIYKDGRLREGKDLYGSGAFSMGHRDEYNANSQANVSGIASVVGGALDTLATSFGKKAGYEIATAFADDSSKDGAWGALRISKDGQDLLNWQDTRTSRWAPKEFGDGEAGYKEYLAAVAKDTRQVLLDMDLPSWADKMLESIGESASMEQLSATVQQIAAIKTQFVQLGKAMEMFDGISSGMESALLSAAGSIDALTASAAGYYDAAYTEQEKIARSREQLESTLAGYGQSLPATREQYRALVEQQVAAGESGAEFAVVLMGLAGTFAQVVDDIDAQFADLAKSAADVFSPLLESIKQARADVAGTRANMLKSDQAMTASQIAAAIGAAMVYAPNTAGVMGAQGEVAAAASQVAISQSALDAARAVASANQQSILAGLNKAVAPRTSAPGMTNDSLWEEIIGRNWQAHVARFGKGWNTSTTTDAERAAAMNAMAREYADAKNADVYAAANWQSGQDAPAIAAAQSALAAAQAALATAQQSEVQARADYAAQLNQFVTAAGGSVSKLSGLREEVVRFYEEQAQAVQSMIATAENLRNVVGSIRMGQLDSAQTAAQLGGSYASDYSMALATTGSTRAGYAESLASTLPTLAEAIKTEAISASDWRVQTGKLLAQATGVAGMLEADAAGNDYQSVSLGLLGSIDTALAQLEGSTQSAEQVISQAIKDGTTAQLTGLRAVVAALRGDPIPAFATGGFHAGGLRLVGENGPELEATGPSRIWSAQQTAALFAGNGQGSNEALVSEIRALRSENQAQAAAMVNMQRELNKLMQRWDAQGMPEVRVV